MSEYYGVTRSDESLKHYGIKGMKWGVRKALYTGNQKALDRHFRKAAKKLAKLQDIGMRPGKYAAKAAAYGAAAAGTGTLAVGGTMMARKGMANAGQYLRELSKKMDKYSSPKMPQHMKEIEEHIIRGKRGSSISRLALKPEKLSTTQVIAKHLSPGVAVVGNKLRDAEIGLGKFAETTYHVPFGKKTIAKGHKVTNKIPITGETIFRAGTGLVTAGLAAKSAQNAYRATHSKKYRAKADTFRNAMDESFAGTQYAGKYVYQKPKRRKRR